MVKERQPIDSAEITQLSEREIQDSNHQLVGDVHRIIAHQSGTYSSMSQEYREMIHQRIDLNRDRLGIEAEVESEEFLADVMKRDQELTQQRRPAYWFGTGTVSDGTEVHTIFRDQDSAIEQSRDPRVILIKDIKRGPAIEKRISEHLDSEASI